MLNEKVWSNWSRCICCELPQKARRCQRGSGFPAASALTELRLDGSGLAPPKSVCFVGKPVRERERGFVVFVLFVCLFKHWIYL